MYEIIENNKYVYELLIAQTRNWWGRGIDSNIIKKFIHLYKKYMIMLQGIRLRATMQTFVGSLEMMMSL